MIAVILLPSHTDPDVQMGLSNSSVTVTEGGPNQRVCVEFMSLDQQLDPSNFITLTLRNESLGKFV